MSAKDLRVTLGTNVASQSLHHLQVQRLDIVGSTTPAIGGSVAQTVGGNEAFAALRGGIAVSVVIQKQPFTIRGMLALSSFNVKVQNASASVCLRGDSWL